MRGARLSGQAQCLYLGGHRASGEGSGDEWHRQKRHAGDEHARGERPSATELQRWFDKLTANAASSPALSMMNEFCAGRESPGYACPHTCRHQRRKPRSRAKPQPHQRYRLKRNATDDRRSRAEAIGCPARLPSSRSCSMSPKANREPLTHPAGGSTLSMNGVM